MLGAVTRADQRCGPLLEAGPLAVLLLDDLCGGVRVGDLVLACCAGRHSGPAAPDRRTCGFGTVWSVQASGGSLGGIHAGSMLRQLVGLKRSRL